jgi:WD40 repeat protein
MWSDPFSDPFPGTVEGILTPRVRIRDMAWSPNGQYLALSQGGYLYVYNIKTTKSVLRVRIHALSIAWSPSGDHIAACGEGRIVVVSFPDGDIINLSRQSLMYSIAWSPNGQILAAGTHDRSIVLWDCANNKILRSIPNPSGIVYSVAWSPDSHYIAAGAIPVLRHS